MLKLYQFERTWGIPNLSPFCCKIETYLRMADIQQTYQQKPVRYEYVLTKKGEDLKPVLQSLAKWGITYYPGTKIFEAVGRP